MYEKVFYFNELFNIICDVFLARNNSTENAQSKMAKNLEETKQLELDLLPVENHEMQALVEEAIKEEQENPEIVLSEGFVRIFKSERYNRVLEIGNPAMKPLYWIIYKSPNAGMYECICAMALYELSGYDFLNEDGSLSWTNSKEFVERFNEKILTERK